MTDGARLAIGIWSELGLGARWANEGVSRVFGFIIEGAARSGAYQFHVVVHHGLAEDVRADLRTLDAVEGRDWVVHEPKAGHTEAWIASGQLNNRPMAERYGAALAHFAQLNVTVDGWIISFPHFLGALYLDAPKTVLMPDALAYDFPTGWLDDDSWGEKGFLVEWLRMARRVIAACDTVLAFSKHVAERHIIGLLGTPREKVHVVPLAPPDLSTLLPFIVDRRRSDQSRAEAAHIIRRHVACRGDNYLIDFPFDEADFVVVATQDRPTKNIGRAAEAVRRIVREDRTSMKLVTTAGIHFREPWTTFPILIEGHQFQHDAISLRDVPRDVHTSLFHCAVMTVHPTHFEGIIGSLPFFESLSVGTPCILARGPHVTELIELEPAVRDYTFDPYDIDGLVALIRKVAANREAVLEVQMAVYRRLRQRSWKMVADAYVGAALEGRRRLGDRSHG